MVAERPKRCCLDVTKAERKLKAKFLKVDVGLMEMKERMAALTS